MARKKPYNPEKRTWRGRSHKKGGERVRALADGESKKLDVKALIEAFDGMIDVFFPKSKPPEEATDAEVLRRVKDRRLVELAFRVASFWRRARLDERLTGQMEPFFHRLLDELERETRGDDRSCQCLAFKDSGGKSHDVQCPAARRP